jgi:gliding motility-associated-like protein
LCYNQPLNVNGPNGATSYSWVGPGFTSSLQNLSLPNTTTANIGTYSLTVDLNGCKTYGSIFVDVQTPISWGNIVQPQPLCKGQTFTISAQAQGGSGNYAYNWNPVTYILGPNGDTQTGVAVSTTIYNIDVFDIACPYYKIYNTIVLNVNQPPIPKLTVPNYSCEPYCQIFNSKVNYEAATVLYTFNGSKQVMGDSVKVCLSSGLYNVNVTTFGLNGCKGSFDYPKLITVYPKPEADFTWSPQEPNTVSENFVTFYPKEQNNESYYSWFLSETDTSNSLIPSRYFYEPGKYPISLLLTNKFGCKDTATKVIEIVEEELFFLPNSFTPNGDGSNDIFAPKGLGFKSYTLSIFDRWGQVILSPSNNSQGWDGKFKGDICQDGVYVYQVTVLDKNGKRHTRTGHVTLMK